MSTYDSRPSKYVDLENSDSKVNSHNNRASPYYRNQNTTNNANGYISNAKKRVDWPAMVYDCNTLTDIEMVEKYQGQYARHATKIRSVANSIQREKENEENMKALKKRMEDVVLKDWQAICLERLLSQNDRKVLFVVDLKGKSGKSFLGSYILANYSAEIFEKGTPNAMRYAWKMKDIAIFDLARNKMNYEIIDRIKDGALVSYLYKYHTKMKSEASKVIVLMNDYPDYTKLSADKYDVYVLNN